MTPPLPLHILGPDDTTLHAAYCDYVAQVFRKADFRRWCSWGQWNDDYRAFVLVDNGVVVANASVMRMRLLLDGVETLGFQLGAVGCLPSLRGRGLARQVLEAALAYCGEAPVLLFANENVREFYPRFGFRAAAQSLFEIDYAAAPAGERLTPLDLADAALRREFLHIADTALPSSKCFAARQYGRIATWYAANRFTSEPRRLDQDTWVFAQVDDGVLLIEDVFALRPFDLRAAVPRLIDTPIHTIRFGMTPDRLCPQARVVGIDDDADLFVRHFDLPEAATRFPLLART